MKFQLISTKNAKLEKDGIVSINLPCVITCPGAGECKKYCYAQVGPMSWPRALNRRMNAFNLFKKNPKKFEADVNAEIHLAGRRIVRWQDSGDIPNLSYLKLMVRVAIKNPDIKFYTYTKSIKIVLKFGFENLPSNLKVIQSFGGKHDHLIDLSKPFARIFLNKESIPADFTNCSESDYQAATTATKIAIVVHGMRKNQFKG